MLKKHRDQIGNAIRIAPAAVAPARRSQQSIGAGLAIHHIAANSSAIAGSRIAVCLIISAAPMETLAKVSRNMVGRWKYRQENQQANAIASTPSTSSVGRGI